MMTNNQIVCVKRPELSFNASFEDMYLNERLVDVTLFCNDGQIQAHKLVLAASSPYFSNLFEKLSNPFHQPVVVLKDMRIDDLKLILEFIYRGQLAVSQDRMTSLIKSAENLQISGLSTANAMEYDHQQHHSINNTNSTKKRSKKGSSSNTNSIQVAHTKSYQTKYLTNTLLDNIHLDSNQTNNISHHATFFSSNDPTGSSIRNLNTNNSLHTPSPTQSSLHHLQNLPNLDSHNHSTSQNNHSDMQILSQSTSSNRSNNSSFPINNGHNNNQQHYQQQNHQVTNNGNNHNQLQSPQQHSPRGAGGCHQCNICLKPFREKANLKRHLTIHSQDRVIYPCPDCNKTFSWKDNYIRHTKTSHHINNVRTRR